jgi:hypothetical protein
MIKIGALYFRKAPSPKKKSSKTPEGRPTHVGGLSNVTRFGSNCFLPRQQTPEDPYYRLGVEAPNTKTKKINKRSLRMKFIISLNTAEIGFNSCLDVYAQSL